MSLIKWNPFAPATVNTLFDKFGDLFNFSDSIYTDKGFKMDVWEDEGSINVKAEIPGVDKNSITIEFKEDVLTVSVNQKTETVEEDATKQYFRKEISNKNFTRHLFIPNVDSEKIDASYKDGYLNIRIPKIPEIAERVKKIDVK